MPLNSHDSLTDEQFERRLLESAQCDSRPGSTDQAWANFAGMMQQLAAGTEAGSGLHQAVGKRSDQLPNGAGIVSPTGVRPALQWLLVGALAGSAITATAMLVGRAQSTHEPVQQSSREMAIVQPRSVASSRLDTSRAAAENDVVAALAAPVTSVPLHSRGGHASAVALSRHSGFDPVALAPSPSHQPFDSTASPSTASSSSDLAEQVRRVDAARTALAVGNYQEALRAVSSYHREFPKGALRLDADVVAIEALAAQHDAAEVARRAAAFLAEHPDDPHAARVKWLAEH